VDEEVASLYNKIGAPVLTDVELNIEGVTIDSMYPTMPLPDLFAGTQLTVVGRYRGGADGIDISLSGTVGDEHQTFVYDDMDFRERAGGEPFIARLWATRRIGDLLNSIRLHGENPELVDSIVNLSVRYGIITPYTSFLIEEDDILSQTGRARAADAFAEGEALDLRGMSSGSAAVDAAEAGGGMLQAEAPVMAMPTNMVVPAADASLMTDEEVAQQVAAQNPIRTANDKTFIQQNGVWTDTTFDPDTMETQKVVFLSDEYFALLTENPLLGDYFALGERVIVVVDGVAYEVVTE